MPSGAFAPPIRSFTGCVCPPCSLEMMRGPYPVTSTGALGGAVGEGGIPRRREFSPLLVPAKMTGVATPRLLPGPGAPGREVLPWLRKRRPLRKTSSCRVQSGGAGGARAAGRDENRLGGSWMEARATLFWGDRGVPQRRRGSPRTVFQPPPLVPPSPSLGSAYLTQPAPTRHVHQGTLSQRPPAPVPTLMWKADREMLGLPVVQRKRSC